MMREMYECKPEAIRDTSSDFSYSKTCNGIAVLDKFTFAVAETTSENVRKLMAIMWQNCTV
jgi:hypothetical protein